MLEDLEKIAFEELEKKEKASGLEYTDTIYSKPAEPSVAEVEEKPRPSLGKASFVEDPMKISGMESPWKRIPLTNLPSNGFGYPEGTEILVKAASVNEIKHFSTIDETDPISIDEKMNYIVSKFTSFRCDEGTLNTLDIHQEDRFYVFMMIRDLTFLKGENKIFIPIAKDCKEAECPIPQEIELTSNSLSSFKLDPTLIKYYNKDRGCFELTPNNGDPAVLLFIPTIGVSTEIRKILNKKREKNKKFDEVFAACSPYLIPNWRGLDEKTYDQYEALSKEWTYTQFAIADDISKQITFATKDTLSVVCNKCGAEVTAPIRFRGGIRSLFVVSNVIGKLL
jgi:hypothetical protein